jgi:hypothetical protein
MADDFQRYVEYLQSKMLAEGWEGVFDYSASKEKINDSYEKFRQILKSQGFSDKKSLVQNFERYIDEFKPSSQFDSPFTNQIFEPYLKKIQATAKRIGLKPIRPVQLANSTEIGPSPVARPSDSSHLLFIGFGTSTFCNYWAKAHTAIVKAIARHNPKTVINKPDDLDPVFAADPSGIILSGRFALHYAVHGTLIGFGKINQPEDFLPVRSLLLDAMELFVVAHEFAHFVAEERLPEFKGMLNAEKIYELEVFCDRLGIALCRSSEEKNFFAFAGIGAIALFRAVQLCEASRELLIELKKLKVVSSLSKEEYPSLENRIKVLKEQICETTADDQREHVQRFAEEHDLILKSVNDIVLHALRRALTSPSPVKKD